MTEPREKPGRGSWAWWLSWLGVGLAVELWSLRKGGPSPLTSVLTYGPLRTAFGSGIIGAALLWALWHLGFDNQGLDWVDGAIAALGWMIASLAFDIRQGERARRDAEP